MLEIEGVIVPPHLSICREQAFAIVVNLRPAGGTGGQEQHLWITGPSVPADLEMTNGLGVVIALRLRMGGADVLPRAEVRIGQQPRTRRQSHDNNENQQ